ncbi:hypothetical protein pb186bvf_012419 [Paramecium bursaria]
MNNQIGGNGQVFLCTDIRRLEFVRIVNGIGFHNYHPKLYESHVIQLRVGIQFFKSNLDQNCEFQGCFQIPLKLIEFRYMNIYKLINLFIANKYIYQFLLLLHQDNYAHRDIIPENIINVKDVGWILADFLESLYYEISQGMYKIKGTLEFILPDKRKHFKLNRQITQDLFRNDIYSTVCTLGMIKNPQFKSKELQQFIEENQFRLNLFNRGYTLIKIRKISKFRYLGKSVNRGNELVQIIQAYYPFQIDKFQFVCEFDHHTSYASIIFGGDFIKKQLNYKRKLN